MSKQEVIRKAYKALGVKPNFEHIDNNGWTAMFNEIGDKITPTFSELGFSQEQSDKLLDSGLNRDTGKLEWRPKSLKGIENNNGWIKIESEADLPKDSSALIWVYTDKGNIYNYFFYSTWFSINEIEEVTHYQRITKPLKPIY